MGASQDKLGAMAMVNNQNQGGVDNWKTVQEEIQKLSKDPSQRELYRILQMQFKDGDGRGNSKTDGNRGSSDNKDNPDCIVELLKGGKRPIGSSMKVEPKAHDTNRSADCKTDDVNVTKPRSDVGLHIIHGSPKSGGVPNNYASYSATPGHSGTTPGHNGATPGHSGATPGHSGATPGHSGATPSHSGATPGHSGATPGHSGATLGHSSAPSAASHLASTSPGNSNERGSPRFSHAVASNSPPAGSTSVISPSPAPQQSDVPKPSIPTYSPEPGTALPPKRISEKIAPKKKFLEGYRSRSSSFTSGYNQSSPASSAPSSVSTVDSQIAGKTSLVNHPGKFLNIRNCIEKIMESELVRKTLQDDSTESLTVTSRVAPAVQVATTGPHASLPHAATSYTVEASSMAHTSGAQSTLQVAGVAKPLRRYESDEDSNMPLLPHDIQKQIKSVYNPDIEQDRNNERAMHASQIQAIMVSRAMMMGQHPSVSSEVKLAQGHASSPAPPHHNPLPEGAVYMPEGAIRPGMPPHFRPYPTRVPMPPAVEHLVTVPYPFTATGAPPRFPSPAISQEHRPETQVSVAKTTDSPAMGVIRPMVHTFRPGSQGADEGLPSYPMFPPMGVRLPGGHLGVPLVPVPHGGIMTGRPPMPMPSGIQLPADHQRLPHHIASASMVQQQQQQQHSSAGTPVVPVAPHGVACVPGQQVPMHLLQVNSTPRMSAPVPHLVQATPKVMPPIMTHVPGKVPYSVTPMKESVHEDYNDPQRAAQVLKGAISEPLHPLRKEDYPAEYAAAYRYPPPHRDGAKDKQPQTVDADEQDEPLDLSTKKSEGEGSLAAAGPVQHGSTHLMSLQQTMQKHMEGISTQPYEPHVLVQSAPGLAAGQVSQLRVQGAPQVLPPSIIHASRVPCPPLSVHSLPATVSPRPCQDSFTGQPTAAATRIDRRGSSYDSNSSHGESLSLDDRSPSPASRVSIASILGDHPPNDILFLKCSQCTSTYGSLHSFKKHFSKAHGREPTKDDVTIQSISATRTALEKENSAERQEALRSLNLLPSNKYYESQIARYKTNDFDDEDHPTAFVLKGEEGVLLEGKLPKSPIIPGEEEMNDDNSPSSDSDKFEELKVKAEAGEQNTMKCLQCGQEFPTRDWGVFRRHVRAHEYPLDGQFRCSVCRQGFREEYQWRHHMSTSHMMQSCRCRKCNIAFTHVGDLNKHLQTSHRGGHGDVEYKCLYCIKTFLSPNDLLLHTQDHERKFEYQNRNKQQGKLIPPNGRQDKPMCVPPPIVRKATPDTTYSEDKKSPNGSAPRDKTLPDPGAASAEHPRPETMAASGQQGELERYQYTPEHSATAGYVPRSSSAPDLQHSESPSKLSEKALPREYVDVYDIIRLKMEAAHQAEKTRETAEETKTGEKEEVARYVAPPPEIVIQPATTKPVVLQQEVVPPGMHRLPAQVQQPHHRHTPEPRHSRSPVAPPRDVRHSPHPRHSQLPLLHSVLDQKHTPGLTQYRVTDQRPERKTPEPARVSPPQPARVSPPQPARSTAETERRDHPHHHQRPAVSQFQHQLQKQAQSQLQQHLLGVAAPFAMDPRHHHHHHTSPALQTLADAAANSKPVTIKNGGSSAPHSPEHVRHAPHQAGKVGVQTGHSHDGERGTEHSLKRSHSDDANSADNSNNKLMLKNARTVLDEIVENALTQHQDEDANESIGPLVRSKILQSLALEPHALSPFGASVVSIQQRQQACQQYLAEVPKKDTTKDSRPCTPHAAAATERSSDSHHESGMPQTNTNRPGNVRDIIESLVTAELLNSNDADQVKEEEEEEESTHVLSQAIRKLYGLPKSGKSPGPAAAGRAKVSSPPVRVTKISEIQGAEISTLVKIDGEAKRPPQDRSDGHSEHGELKQVNSPRPLVHSPQPSQTPPLQDRPKTSGPSVAQMDSVAMIPCAGNLDNANSQSQSPTSGNPMLQNKNTPSDTTSRHRHSENSSSGSADCILKRKLPHDSKYQEVEKEVEIKRPRST